MKRFTFLLLAAFVTVVAFAQLPVFKGNSFAPKAQTGKVFNLDKENMPLKKKTGELKASNRSAADFPVISEQPAGELKTYFRTGNYYYGSGYSPMPSYVYTQAGTIDIVWGSHNKVYFKDIISNAIANTWVEGTVSNDGKTITVPLFQNIYYASNYDAGIQIVLFRYDEANNKYVPDDTTDKVIFNVKNDTISMQEFDGYASLGAVYSDDGYVVSFGDFNTVYEPGAVPPVELPESADVQEYVMVYKDSLDAKNVIAVNVAVDGYDVYIQGLSEYLPDAWVKGTMDDNVVTFPANQYMGAYDDSYNSFAFSNGDVVFIYDPDANTYTAEGITYGRIGGEYYDGYYIDPVIQKAVDQGATPADPSILAMIDTGTYGWKFTYKVPLVDVNGEPMIPEFLTYKIYAEIDGEAYTQVFTPATHTRLTEEMYEIPYGFYEGWDFYWNSTYGTIYLNDLYSEDWSKIGIQSIYRGGSEEHESNLVWYDLTATGITGLSADDFRNPVIYNLSGQRLQAPQKGVNIINGKKVLIK